MVVAVSIFRKFSNADRSVYQCFDFHSPFQDHEYILCPVSAMAKMKRFTTPLPLRNNAVPRNTIDLTLESMAFAVSEDQYRNMVQLLQKFNKFEKSKRYRKWRPTCPVHNKWVVMVTVDDTTVLDWPEMLVTEVCNISAGTV